MIVMRNKIEEHVFFMFLYGNKKKPILRENKKNTVNLSTAEFAQRMVKVNALSGPQLY